MGRRKIEIKAIKDDRNRSVTFLKRKGGLFKKAHELSVLCSVDVAVFIFGSNKKLYEYSSSDMRELITKYYHHGGPTEHKGPSDFNGGADEEEDEDENGTPPQQEHMEAHMMPPHFQGHQAFPPHMRQHTPSASPPMPNGVQFAQHVRGHTPQPQMGSRPASRNDMRMRPGPPMMAQPVGPHPPPPGAQVNGFAFVPQPAIYQGQNPNAMAPHMAPQMAAGAPYPYPPPPPQGHPHHMAPYMEDQRRSSMPPSFPPQGPPPPHHQVQRHSVSPPQPHSHQLPQLAPPRMGTHTPPTSHPHQSPPQHHPHHAQGMESPPQPPIIHEPAPAVQPPPPPMIAVPEIKTEPAERIPQNSLLDTAVKKLPRQKQHSIFTPIDESRSILSQHLAAFQSEPQKMDSTPPHRASVDNSMAKPAAPVGGPVQSPPMAKRPDPRPRTSVSSVISTTSDVPAFTPPSRSNSLRVGGPRPRLTVQIPDEASDDNSATQESASSPRGGASTDATSNSTRRGTESVGSRGVLPPPSPSASAILSAGASGPPNPFARPPPQSSSQGQQNGQQPPAPANGATAGGNPMAVDTPVSALPSRFLNNEFLPSPSSFFHSDWNYRANDSNTLPSPLNFATPINGAGPSFLRDDNGTAPGKRKSPDLHPLHHHHEPPSAIEANEPKRVKVE